MAGHPETLRPFTNGNTAAVKSGVYSGRVLAPRAAEIRDALLSLPHVEPLDVLAGEEIGSVAATLEAIDRELEGRPKAAARKSLLEHKARLSKLLLSHLREVGATPRSRWEFGRALAHGARYAAGISTRRVVFCMCGGATTTARWGSRRDARRAGCV